LLCLPCLDPPDERGGKALRLTQQFSFLPACTFEAVQSRWCGRIRSLCSPLRNFFRLGSMLRATPVNSLQIGTRASERPFTLLKRLPASGPPFQGQSSWPIPSAQRSSFAGPVRSLRSSALSRLAPGSANSTRATRCPVPSERSRPFFNSPLPLGAFAPLPIKAFKLTHRPRGSPNRNARFPSLPAACCF